MAKYSERSLLFSSCGHSGHLLHPGGQPNPPIPLDMIHLIQRSPSALGSGGITPQASRSSSLVSLIRCNNLVQTARPPLSSPPPQQVTESKDRESGWRGSGGSIIQIPHMFPPQCSRVFEIAGMPTDWGCSGAQLKGEHKKKEKGGKLMFPAWEWVFSSFNSLKLQWVTANSSTWSRNTRRAALLQYNSWSKCLLSLPPDWQHYS